MPMSMLKSVCAILAGLALSACTQEQAAAPETRPAPQVSVVTVQTRDIPFTLEFVAQTESSRQVDIVARVSGFLDKIAYREGEMVKQGQLLFVLAFAGSIAASAAALFYRDVKYIVEIVLTFAIFFTPVFFEPEMFGPLGTKLMMLNPLAPLLEGLRLAVIEGHSLLVPLVVHGGGGAGQTAFRRREQRIAQMIKSRIFHFAAPGFRTFLSHSR